MFKKKRRQKEVPEFVMKKDRQLFTGPVPTELVMEHIAKRNEEYAVYVDIKTKIVTVQCENKPDDMTSDGIVFKPKCHACGGLEVWRDDDGSITLCGNCM